MTVRQAMLAAAAAAGCAWSPPPHATDPVARYRPAGRTADAVSPPAEFPTPPDPPPITIPSG